MKTVDLSGFWKKAEKNKYVFLVLLVGIFLLLLPQSGGKEGEKSQSDALESTGVPLETEAAKIAEGLEQIRGTGRAQVLLSKNGAVVVCDGADSAAVRLNVTNAVMAYTGLGSDKIWVMKMK